MKDKNNSKKVDLIINNTQYSNANKINLKDIIDENNKSNKIFDEIKKSNIELRSILTRFENEYYLFGLHNDLKNHTNRVNFMNDFFKTL